MDDQKCHICGELTEWECERCGEPVCEKCCVPFTQFNQCTETICNDCGDHLNDLRAIEIEREEKNKEIQEKIEDCKKWERLKKYNSPEQIEKRAKKKIERRERKRLIIIEEKRRNAKALGNIFKGFGL
jgi:hypothetical protein